MPRTRRTVAAAAAAAFGLVAALAGCDAGSTAPSSPPPTPSPSAPIFASDEEALAAAEAAYAAYAAVDAEISGRGGTNLAGLDEVLGPPYLDEMVSDYEAMARSGFRATGAVKIVSARLMEYVPAVEPEQIQVYACVSVGETRIFDRHGVDVTPAGRDDTVALHLEFEVVPERLLLVGSEAWGNPSFCQ